jgi:hypothetical protein
VKYGCLKITRCSEDNFRVEKQGNTCNSGDIGDNATWDNSQLKFRDIFRFLEKKFHDILLTTPFCMNESFPCSL